MSTYAKAIERPKLRGNAGVSPISPSAASARPLIAQLEQSAAQSQADFDEKINLSMPGRIIEAQNEGARKAIELNGHISGRDLASNSDAIGRARNSALIHASTLMVDAKFGAEAERIASAHPDDPVSVANGIDDLASGLIGGMVDVSPMTAAAIKARAMGVKSRLVANAQAESDKRLAQQSAALAVEQVSAYEAQAAASSSNLYNSNLSVALAAASGVRQAAEATGLALDGTGRSPEQIAAAKESILDAARYSGLRSWFDSQASAASARSAITSGVLKSALLREGDPRDLSALDQLGFTERAQLVSHMDAAVKRQEAEARAEAGRKAEMFENLIDIYNSGEHVSDDLTREAAKAASGLDPETRARFEAAASFNLGLRRLYMAPRASANDAIDAMEAAGVSTKEDVTRLKAARSAMAKRDKMLADDPLGLLEAAGWADVPEIDFAGSQEGILSAMNRRVELARVVSQVFPGAHSIFSKADAKQIVSVFDSGDADQQERIWNAISTLPREVDQARVIQEFSKGHPALALAASLRPVSPSLAESIRNGQDVIRANPKVVPPQDAGVSVSDELREYAKGALAGNAIYEDAVISAAISLAARNAQNDGRGDGQGDRSRFVKDAKRGFSELVGEPMRFRGRNTVPPIPSMTSADFATLWFSMNATDIVEYAEPTRDGSAPSLSALDGREIDIEDIKYEARPVLVGPGVYRLQMERFDNTFVTDENGDFVEIDFAEMARDKQGHR